MGKEHHLQNASTFSRIHGSGEEMPDLKLPCLGSATGDPH